MENLIFNELSIQPYPVDIQALDMRMKELINLFKIAKEKYNIKKISFSQELEKYKLLEDNTTFLDYVLKQNLTFQNLFFSIKQYPFYDNENEPQVAKFVSNHFFVKDKQNNTIKCDGLGIAYLYDILAIGFASADIWDNVQIDIFIQGDEGKIETKVFQMSKPIHLQNDDLISWINANIQNSVQTLQDLKKLYPNYYFENKAFEDILYWKNNNKEIYQRLHLLLKDIEIHPFKDGLGKTEALKHSSNISKRLSQVHRIEYSLTGKDKNKIITIYSCKGHYDDK